MKTIIVYFFLLTASTSIAFAHGGKKHKKDSTKVHADSIKHEHIQGDTVHHHDKGMKVDESKITADFDDFPTMHPLIVHFAIVLIIVAAALQLLNIVLIKKEIAWIVAGFLFVGFLAAWFAAGKFHPHTHGISDHAQQVLDQHDKWADWTKISAFIALVLQIANLFFFQSKRWAMGVVAAILVISAYSVSRAGHYGSQLVHIEGIGPQGKYLEMEHHH